LKEVFRNGDKQKNRPAQRLELETSGVQHGGSNVDRDSQTTIRPTKTSKDLIMDRWKKSQKDAELPRFHSSSGPSQFIKSGDTSVLFQQS